MKETPATGVLDGQEAGVLELTLGVQPPPPPLPPPPPPVETLPPQPQIAARQKAARLNAPRGAEIEIVSGSERKMRGSFTVVFPISLRSEVASSELAHAFARCAYACSQCARAAHESQHDGWIFRRVVASGLRAERKSNGGQCQGQEKSVAGVHSNLLYSIHDCCAQNSGDAAERTPKQSVPEYTENCLR